MTKDETAELQLFRKEVKQDIELAIANFKIWLLVTVLTNVILIGVPALYVFFTTQNTAKLALEVAMDSRKRLDDHSQYLTLENARVSAIERHLEATDKFQPPAPVPVPR